MRVAVMQPYLFPYIGYFQLMKSVDLYVSYDDVQFMKSGWINRNRILKGDSWGWFTLPVMHDSYKKPITDRKYLLSPEARSRALRQIDAVYRKAPHFSEVIALIERILAAPTDNVATFNEHSHLLLAQELGLEMKYVNSSSLDFDRSLRGHERLINLCQSLQTKTYINPIGGLSLYTPAPFTAAGIDLRFLKTRRHSYRQFGAPHVPYLSIIDVLMFNDQDQRAELLAEYDVLHSDEALSLQSSS